MTGALKMIIDGLSKWLFSGDEAMMMSALTIMPGTTIEAASAVSAATEAAAARSLSCCWPAYPPLPPRGIRLKRTKGNRVTSLSSFFRCKIFINYELTIRQTHTWRGHGVLSRWHPLVALVQALEGVMNVTSIDEAQK